MRPAPLLGQIDRYLLVQMAPRMVVAMLITVVALLLERLLRLLDFITGQGVGIAPVLGMVLNLFPHYMGLALPAAFCAGILITLSGMAKANEIDVLEAAGWSLRRIGAPFLLCAGFLTVFSALLFGVVQPYSRYAFNELRHAIRSAGWDGRVEQGVFLDLGNGMTLSAADIDASGRVLYGVFVAVEGTGTGTEAGGGETLITAEKGHVVTSPDGKSVVLVLTSGQALPASGGVLDFDTFQLDRRFDPSDHPFRPRGGSERELTFIELWRQMHRSAAEPVPDAVQERRFAAEFHGRLVRALSLVGIALITVPLSVARKRAGVWPRTAMAVVILAAYDNLIKLAVGYAELGVLAPEPALWGAFALFHGIGLWLYLATAGQGGRTPLRLVYKALGAVRRRPAAGGAAEAPAGP